jgi:hypothetical protein
VRERALTVEINLLPLLAAEGQSHHRRELALAAQQAIAGALDVPTGPAYGRRVAQGTPG